MSEPKQIPIRFPEADLDFDQLTVTPANRAILAAVRRSDHWPYHVFCLVGSSLSGLTTIAKAWARERGGTYMDGKDFAALKSEQIETLASNDFAIDRPDLISDQTNLLFAVSAAERLGSKMLLAAGSAPATWQSCSPDLMSRLRSAPIAEIPLPDEPLMRARLKRACDRAYLNMPIGVEDYLVTRLGLDYSRIEYVIEALAGLAADRPLTIPLVRKVLGQENDEAN